MIWLRLMCSLLNSRSDYVRLGIIQVLYTGRMIRRRSLARRARAISRVALFLKIFNPEI